MTPFFFVYPEKNKKNSRGGGSRQCAVLLNPPVHRCNGKNNLIVIYTWKNENPICLYDWINCNTGIIFFDNSILIIKNLKMSCAALLSYDLCDSVFLLFMCPLGNMSLTLHFLSFSALPSYLTISKKVPAYADDLPTYIHLCISFFVSTVVNHKFRLFLKYLFSSFLIVRLYMNESYLWICRTPRFTIESDSQTKYQPALHRFFYMLR
jgi:hypothetical protein